MSKRITPEISDGLYGFIREEAERRGRTMTSQIAHMLEDYRERAARPVPVIKSGNVVAMSKSQ